MRAKIENECNSVAKGLATKDAVISRNIRIFERKFHNFAMRIDRLPLMLAVAYAKSKGSSQVAGDAAGEGLQLWKEAETLQRSIQQVMQSSSAAHAGNIDCIHGRDQNSQRSNEKDRAHGNDVGGSSKNKRKNNKKGQGKGDRGNPKGGTEGGGDHVLRLDHSENHSANALARAGAHHSATYGDAWLQGNSANYSAHTWGGSDANYNMNYSGHHFVNQAGQWPVSGQYAQQWWQPDQSSYSGGWSY